MNTFENYKKKLVTLLEKQNYTTDNFSVSFNLEEIKSSDVYIQNGTRKAPVMCQVSITTKDGFVGSTRLNLLNLLASDNYGYLINNARNNYIGKHDLADGWYIIDPKKDINIYESTEEEGKKDRLEDFHEVCKLKIGRKDLLFTFKSNMVKFSNKGDITAGDYLKAITGKSFVELKNLIGYNRYTDYAFRNEKSLNETIENIYSFVYNKDITKKNLTRKAELIRNRFNNPKTIYLNKYERDKTKKFVSFKSRALNKILAKDLDIIADGKQYKFKSGDTLTEDMLNIIDISGITKLLVEYNQKTYDLRKYKIEDTFVSEGELLTVLNIYLCSLDGFDTSVSYYDYKSRIRRSLEDEEEIYILNNVKAIRSKINEGFMQSQNSETLEITCIEVIKNISSSSSKLYLNPDEFIDEHLQDKGIAGHLRLCEDDNIASLASEQSRSTMDSKNIADEGTAVQYNQRNRIDPTESPESQNIGKDANGAIHLKINEDGMYTTPYIKVVNGVSTDEIVYVAASDEEDKYVASWEMDLSEDAKNSTDKITAYFNDSVLLVDRSQIHYKEYSCLQSASKIRNLLPFPNFSNTKRLLMGANHTKQTVYNIKGERPFVGTGVESMFPEARVTAYEIIDNYIDDNIISLTEKGLDLKKIRESEIKLYSTTTEKDTRKLVFKFINIPKLENATLECMSIFMKKTSNSFCFTFEVNNKTDLIFKGDDIVVYNSMYDIDEKEILGCMKYGEMKVDTSEVYTSIEDAYRNINNEKVKSDKLAVSDGSQVFEVTAKDFKTGTALGRNFVIAVKTHGSSSIEDAIVIRKGLITNDEMTNIQLHKESVKIRSTSTVVETFYFNKDDDETDSTASWIDDRGLPKVGTRLKPGDEVIYKKVVSTDNTGKRSTLVPKRLDNNTEGVVVYADIIESKKNSKTSESEAVVILGSFVAMEPGDKASGRYGNKGVISKVENDENMPFIKETGQIVDIVLNPLGFPSRSNLGQLPELKLGMAVKLLREATGIDFVSIVSNYHPDSLDFAKHCSGYDDTIDSDISGDENFKDKFGIDRIVVPEYTLVDGRTGNEYKRPVNVGVMYIYKAIHQVHKKMHAIGKGTNVSDRTGMSKKGKKAGGGQKVGEYETWAYLSNGGNGTLQTMFSVLSDDKTAKNKLNKAIMNDPYNVDVTGKGSNQLIVQMVTRALGIDITVNNDNSGYGVSILSDEKISKLTSQPVQSEEDLHVLDKSSGFKSRGVNSERQIWRYIDLKTKIVNPYLLDKTKIPNMIVLRNFDKFYEKRKSDFQYKDTIMIEPGDILSSDKGIAINLTSDKINKFLDSDSGNGEALLYEITSKLGKSYFYYCSTVNSGYFSVDPNKYIIKTYTGMEAIIRLFEDSKLEDSLKYYKNILDKADEVNADKHMGVATMINNISSWIESGETLSNCVTTLYPVIPEVYRPEMMMDNNKHSYDKRYDNIINAVEQKNTARVYNEIKGLVGLLKNDDSGDSNISEDYLGVGNDDKSNFRDEALSKVVDFSGRTVIIPMENMRLHIDEIGLPLAMGVAKWELHLCTLLHDKDKRFGSPLREFTSFCDDVESSSQPDSSVIKVARYKKILTTIVSNNIKKFENLVKTHLNEDKIVSDLQESTSSGSFDGLKELFFKVKKFIIQFLETRIVYFGRQPTLHKFGIRSFYVVIIEKSAIELNPLVCKGYNADFDGDQMYTIGAMTDIMIKEAKELFMPMRNVVNPRDRKPILEHSQDMLLGCYFATMLRDNTQSIELNDNLLRENYIFLEYDNLILNKPRTKGRQAYLVPSSFTVNSVEELIMLLDCGDLEYSDLVHLNLNGNNYLSTAGRIYFNSLIPGGFTCNEFTNPLNIYGVKSTEYCDLKYDGLISKDNTEIKFSKYTDNFITSIYKSIDYRKKEYLDKYNEEITLKEAFDECIHLYGKDELYKKLRYLQRSNVLFNNRRDSLNNLDLDNKELLILGYLYLEYLHCEDIVKTNELSKFKYLSLSKICSEFYLKMLNGDVPEGIEGVRIQDLESICNDLIESGVLDSGKKESLEMLLNNNNSENDSIIENKLIDILLNGLVLHYKNQDNTSFEDKQLCDKVLNSDITMQYRKLTELNNFINKLNLGRVQSTFDNKIDAMKHIISELSIRFNYNVSLYSKNDLIRIIKEMSMDVNPIISGKLLVKFQSIIEESIYVSSKSKSKLLLESLSSIFNKEELDDKFRVFRVKNILDTYPLLENVSKINGDIDEDLLRLNNIISNIIPFRLLRIFQDSEIHLDIHGYTVKGNLRNISWNKREVLRVCRQTLQNIKIESSELYSKIANDLRIEVSGQVYQDVQIFGFNNSDISGITLSLKDFERNPNLDIWISEYKEKQDKFTHYENLGLMDANDVKREVELLWGKAVKVIQKKIIDEMDRNNNLFIIADSGARGNASQTMQAVGFIGMLMKTLNTSIDMPVLNSYSNGLTTTESVMSSYATREGVKSTQSGTPTAGYATRKAVLIMNSFIIVEDDCGKEVKNLTLKYGLPYQLQFKRNENDAFEKVSDVDINSLSVLLSDLGRFNINLDYYKTNTTNKDVELFNKIMFNFIDFDDKTCSTFNIKIVEQLVKHNIKIIKCFDKYGEEITFRLLYRLDPTIKDLIEEREVVINNETDIIPGLAKQRITYQGSILKDVSLTEKDYRDYLDLRRDVPTKGHTQYCYFITSDTINWLEKENPDSIRVRLLLDCNSPKSCGCRRCYGRKYQTFKLPNIGENLGIESAQSIGEPAAQLTMSLFHQGGLAGTSVDSGVDSFNSFIDGGVPKSSIKSNIAENNGYVSITNLGNKSIIILGEQTIETTPKCLLVTDGEYVDKYSKLTSGIYDPELLSIEKGDNPVDVIRRKQYILLDLYANTFRENGITVKYRHFEILVRFQGGLIDIVSSPSDSLQTGKTYNLYEFSKSYDKMSNSEKDKVVVCAKISNKSKVVDNFSGSIINMGFERGHEVIKNMIDSHNIVSGYSPMQAVMISEDLTDIGSKVKFPDVEDSYSKVEKEISRGITESKSSADSDSIYKELEKVKNKISNDNVQVDDSDEEDEDDTLFKSIVEDKLNRTNDVGIIDIF